MFQRLKGKIVEFTRKRSSGMTLIEVVATIAILAIVVSILLSSYTNVMTDQRKQADISRLETLDIALKQILLYDDAFEEIKPLVYDKNKLQVDFHLTTTNSDGKPSIDLSNAKLNGGAMFLQEECPTLYNYLTEQIDTQIVLESPDHKAGCYHVYIEFGGTQVSEVRDYVITNDTIIVTNSGDSELYQP